MPTLTWIRALVGRRIGRIAGTVAGVALSVALIASIGGFVASSKATMTERSIATVGVDWQVEVQAGSDAASVLSQIQASPYVVDALPVGYAATSGLSATTGGTTQHTGPGFVLGLPAGYSDTFPGEIRSMSGTASGVLVAQQTAANLRVRPSDTINIGRPGMSDATVTVDGVVDLPQADSLFQKVGAPAGAQPTAPPDNVVLVPATTWHELFDPLATSRPDLVHSQIHIRTSHELSTDPVVAYGQALARGNNLEVSLAGSGLVGNNLAAALGSARSDALYAQVLFLFLGLPGAVLAGMLTGVLAGAGAQRRRQEQALLRARGATRSVLVRIGAVEALIVGLAGSILGLFTATIVSRLAFGHFSLGATPGATLLWMGLAAAAGLSVALLTVALPALRDAKEVTVASSRRPSLRAGRPRWTRYGLDILALLLGAGVYLITSRAGYQLVLAPEGVPSISVDYWAFLGPALLWIGAGLFMWRLSELLLRRGRRVVERGVKPAAGPLAGTVAASMSRQRRILTAGLVLVALTAVFALSVSTFDATYRQQAEVDALLTNGAPVTVTEFASSTVGPDAAADFKSIPGVVGVEAIQHRYAYVGSDLQDLYGVDPTTIVDATRLQDSYFAGGTARDLMADLASQPDAVLVSAETVKDFQLHPGDHLKLRLQDGQTKQFKDVLFTYVGVAKEFPTAPSDSFLVANAGYVAQQTGSNAVGAFLLDTGNTPPEQVAVQVQAQVGGQAQVTDIVTARRLIGSSLTAVDLAGLTRVELSYALALAVAATMLVMALGFAERRRAFAILSALGAKPAQIGALAWSEAGYMTVGGLLLGAVGGWAMAEMLVKILNGVFDPPPAALAVPWLYLLAVAALSVIGVAVAVVIGIRLGRRGTIEELRST